MQVRTNPNVQKYNRKKVSRRGKELDRALKGKNPPLDVIRINCSLIGNNLINIETFSNPFVNHLDLFHGFVFHLR